LEYELRRRIPISEQGNTYVDMHLSNEDVHPNLQSSPLNHNSSSDGSRCLTGVHQVCNKFSSNCVESILCNEHLFRAVLEDIVEM